MLTMTQALARLQGDTARFLPDSLLRDLCEDLQLSFRERLLTPLVTTRLFLRQVLHGNAPIAELRRLAKTPFAESSYCAARIRLPLAFFQRLYRAVLGRCRAFTADDCDALWRGRHRVFFLDGSSFSMPDTPELQEEFGQPGNQAAGCGFPVAHLLVQFEAHTGYLVRAIPSPLRTHDLSGAAATHRELRPGDIVGGDRAFCSYAHLALLHQRDCFGLFRAHQRTIVSFEPGRPHRGRSRRSGPAEPGQPSSRWVRRLGRDDQLVEYFKPRECPDWLTEAQYAALPESLLVRELRVKVRTPGRRVRSLTLVTTLLDPRQYPKAAVASLYEQRWAVETNLKHLKQTMKMDVLRCETYKGVCKELMMFAAAYNLVRRVMAEAARKQRVSPWRISFVDALRWLRESERGEELPALKVNPERPGRVEPRKRKRRPKQYGLLNKPRAELREALLHNSSTSKEDAA